MKRLFWFMLVLLFGVSSAQAQEAKFDEAAIIKKVEKLELDSKNPKKAENAVTWLDLGDAYLEAATIASFGLYRGQDELSAKIIFPKPEVGAENIAGTEFVKWSYPYFDVYLKDNAVYFWKTKRNIIDKALDKAVAAYKTAYAKDAKNSKTKVVAGLEKIANAYKQDADNLYVMQDFQHTADVFASAYEIQVAEPVSKADTVASFYAGVLYTMQGKYDQAAKYLQIALDNGCESNGETYYYLFHSYYGQKDYEKAKETLLAGMAKYPKNSQLLEQLIILIAETGEDPASIIPHIQAGIENDPNNPELWAGLGRVYDKMGNTPEALKAFQKGQSLAPDDYSANFNYALMLVRVADSQTDEFNAKTFTSQEEREAAIIALDKVYEVAIAPLEKAHAANPDDDSTIELLKNIYFRLRDRSPEKLQLFEKYDALYKAGQ